MKVVLYMAITANGMIAKKNGETEWSDDEWKFYCDKTKEVGNFITGSVTYPLYEQNDFEEMGDPFVIVLTTRKNKKDTKKVKYVNSPKEAINILKKEGFKTALVTGGGKTNTSFLKEKLIDEIYLDVEPFVYGNGISLFFPTDVNLKLKLLDTRVVNKNSTQLRYKVIK